MERIHRLLLDLARIRLPAAARARLRQECRPEDWSALLPLALRGGIAGLIEGHLEELAVPRAIRLRFAKASLLTERVNRPLLDEGLRLCDRAAAAGLTLIPLKGTALFLGGLYHHPGQRTMADLDLLSSPSELAEVEGLLLAEGYRGHGHQETYRRHMHHLGYEKTVAGVPLLLELHWTALHVMYSRARMDAALIARSRPLPCRGATVRQLCPEDQVLAVALHLAVHRFRAQLKWLVDVAELARALAGTLRWEEVLARAADLGGRRALTYVLSLAGELLDAPLPALDMTRALATLRAASPPEALITSAAQPSWAARTLVNLIQYDSPWGGMSYLLHKGKELLDRLTGLHLPLPRLRR